MHHFHASMITSNMEGFSLALLESLSNGLPAISYDIPYGPSELIVNGKMVILCLEMMKTSFMKPLSLI